MSPRERRWSHPLARRIGAFVDARTVAVVMLAMLAVPLATRAQTTPTGGAMREATRLDSDGRTTEARAILQQIIDTASEPRARAAAHRAMAMSHAFDGDCRNTARYEELVMAYWKTREVEEPQNAFYQQGEMANEAARVCIDVGELDVAERYYLLGSELGLKEPEPKTHPKSLWDYRLAHARARLAARRGKAEDARRHVAEARRILDSDPKMAAAQERFYPYLTGYVALFTNDLASAETELTKAIAIQGNATDPYMHALLAMTYEKMGDEAKARAFHEKAYALATSHNPPAAFTRPYARRKLAR